MTVCVQLKGMQLSPNYILVMQEETFLVLLLKVFPLSTDEPVIAVASETVLKRRARQELIEFHHSKPLHRL